MQSKDLEMSKLEKDLAAAEELAVDAITNVQTYRVIKQYLDRRKHYDDGCLKVRMVGYPGAGDGSGVHLEFPVELSLMILSSMDQTIMRYLEKCQNVLPLINTQLLSYAQSLPANAKSNSPSKTDPPPKMDTSSSRKKKR